VDQFRTLATRTFGEILLFHQSHFQAATRRIDGDTAPGGASTDDQQIEDTLRFQGFKNRLPTHFSTLAIFLNELRFFGTNTTALSLRCQVETLLRVQLKVSEKRQRDRIAEDEASRRDAISITPGVSPVSSSHLFVKTCS
jgi:hypothetical protein